MKRVLYYTRHGKTTDPDSFVVITYTDFTTKVLYKGQPGYKSAAANAARSKRRLQGIRPD